MHQESVEYVSYDEPIDFGSNIIAATVDFNRYRFIL